jgi:hypothetical protein
MTRRRSAVLATILVFPSALFIGASVLEDAFGWSWVSERLGAFADPTSGLARGVVATVGSSARSRPRRSRYGRSCG